MTVGALDPLPPEPIDRYPRATMRKPVLAGAFLLATVAALWLAIVATRSPAPTTPAGAPPVLAGRQLWGSCAGGFYARHLDTIVLTSSAHCASEGTVAVDPTGEVVRGVFGPAAVLEPCEHAATHTCRPSDINYLVVEPEQIPWGRLDVVDLGEGGQRTVAAGTDPLGCDDIELGGRVEINGRDIYRSGTATEKGEYLHDPAADGDYFPCIVAAADVEVGVGDSGGAVLVDGRPAGVSSRSFGGSLGFTPLAEGLEALDLELCTTPDCDLSPS